MHRVKKYRSRAGRCRVLGHESRMQALALLREGAMDLATLAQKLGMSQPSVTKHVQRLSHAGFVEGKREGMRVFFSLTSEARNADVLWRIIQQDFF